MQNSMDSKKLLLSLMIGIFMISLSSADLEDGLISYYKFDGNLIDSLGINDGINDGTTNTSGKIIDGRQFDGSTNKINLTSDINPTTAITYNSWIYRDTTNDEFIGGKWDWDAPLSNNRAYAIQIFSSQLRGYISEDGTDGGSSFATSNVSLNADEWYMITMTFDGSNIKIYVNEVITGITAKSSGISNEAITGTYLGVQNGGGTEYSHFEGKQDEVSFWNRSLTQEEISELYNSGNGISYPFATDPEITLNSPIDYYNTTSVSLDFNVTVIDDKKVQNVSLFIDGILNETNSSEHNGTYIFSKTFIDGNYNWSILAFDNDSVSVQSATRFFTIDSTNPVINIEYPKNLIEYHKLGENLQLNVTATDSNLDTCWYEYNGINNTFSCTSGVKATELFNSISEEKNLIVWANDTLENLDYASTNWDYQFLETARIFNSTALQTGTEIFQLTGIRDSSITSTTAVIYYNGTEYAAVKSGTGNNIIFTSAIGIPTDLTGNASFYWTITYINSTGTFEFNTTSSIQEVFALSLEECFTPAIDGLTLNFTTYDSTNLTILNSTFEATFQFYAEAGSGSMIVEYLFSDLNENRSNYMFCLNSSGQNITLDAFISYSATDYDRREYIIDDGIIGNFTQDIPLYLALTELTDIVTITVQDQTFNPIAGALVAIQEWNVGTNTYSTIGMLTTSSSGQGIIDLELYTTWYRAVVYIDGVLTHVEDVQKLSSTSWIITVETGEDNPYDLFGNIAHGLTFDNETNITSFTWVDTSGYTSKGCMIIQNTTSLGPVTIFDSCVTSVSGTIDYQIVGDGEYHAYGIIFLEGYSQTEIVDELSIRLGVPLITQTISPFGKVISFISIGTAGLIGVSAGSAILGGVLLIAVLIFLMKMGFMNIGWGFIWGIISIMIVVWVLQRRKK